MILPYSSLFRAWRRASRAPLAALALTLAAVATATGQPCTLTPTVTPTQATVCGTGSVQLTAAAGTGQGGYLVNSIPFAADPGGNANPLATGDDIVNDGVPIGFSFTYYGVAFTDCSISTNGNLQFTSAGATNYSPAVMPSPARPNNMLAVCWTDLDFRFGGSLSYETVGSAPNRRFVVNYVDAPIYQSSSSAGPGSFTGQIILFEGTDVIEFHVRQNDNPVKNRAMGIENADGTGAVVPPNRDLGVWLITSPEAWRFAPDNGTTTYAWSPAAGLSATNIANPIASPTTTTTYTVTVTDAQGCVGTAQTTITAQPGPAITSTVPGARCGPGTVELTARGAQPGFFYVWYTVPTGGTRIRILTTELFTTPAITATTTYYVAVMTSLGCEGARVPVVATVNPPLPTPTLAATGPTTGCAGTGVPLTAANGGTGATYQFLLDGQPIAGTTGATYTATQSGAYTVRTTVGACEALSTAVTVTITPAPAAPTATGAARCGTGTVVLTAAGAPTGGTYRWYTQATGGTPIAGATAATYTTPALSATTTYYVAVSSGSCASPRVAVVATVNAAATPTLTAGGPVTFCTGGSVTLTAAATGPGVGYQFLLNGAPIAGASGNVYTATQSGVYSVTATIGACPATSTPITVTVSPQPSAAFGYATSTLCLSGPNPLPIITGTPGGAFSAPTGLSLNATTGQINLTASTPGTYLVTYTVGGTCPASATQTLTLTTAPSAAFAYPSAGPFCAGATMSVAPILGPGASAGSFSASGGLPIDPLTGAIALVGATPGTYTITNSIAASGACPPSTATATVTIEAAPTPTLTAASATTICAGDSVLLTATGGVAYVFVRDGQTLSGAVGATYYATQAGVYAVNANNAAGCNATSSTVTVTVNPVQVAAFAYADSALCLSAAAPLPTITGTTGGTFSAPTGLAIDSTTGAIDLTASVAGTYAVRYTTAGPCPATMSQTLTLSAAPVATFTYTPTGVVCAGSADSLRVTLGTGATGGTFTAPTGLAIDSVSGAIVLANSMAGVYTVTNTVASAGACPAAVATSTITIEAAPTAALVPAGAPAFCAGDSVTLIAAGSGSYQFLRDGQPISGATNATYVATQAGAYAVQVTNTAGCDALSAPVAVTVNPLPTAPTVTVAPFGAGLQQLTATGAGTVQWYLNGVAISGATASVYTVSVSTQSGAYTAVFTDPATGCVSAPSVPRTVTVLSTSRELADGLTFGLAPNPTLDGRVTVTLAGPAATAGGNWQLQVIDATGRVVSRHALVAGHATYELNWQSLPVGVYAVRVLAPTGGALTRRLIRE